MQGNNGPIWYRGYARDGETEICRDLEETLKILGKIMIMGHTYFNEITKKCNGKAYLIDTGISYAMLNNPSALEILQDNKETIQITAVYPDRRILMFHKNLILEDDIDNKNP